MRSRAAVSFSTVAVISARSSSTRTITASWWSLTCSMYSACAIASVHVVDARIDVDHVGRLGLVEVDQHVLERADGLLELGPDLAQIGLRGVELGGRLVELGLLGGELLLDRRLLGADRGLLADQLVDLGVLGLDRRGDLALLGVDLADLGGRVLELVDGLGGGLFAAQREHERQRRQQGRQYEGGATRGATVPLVHEVSPHPAPVPHPGDERRSTVAGRPGAPARWAPSCNRPARAEPWEGTGPICGVT